MRTNIIVFALAAFGWAGCVVEAPPPSVTTTTTEVRREVVTTGPATASVVTAPATTSVVREVIVPQAPPAVRVETRTVSPGPRYVWTRGYWRWTGTNYEWVPGSWVVRPRAGAVWVDGGWVRRSRGWVFVRGHWE